MTRGQIREGIIKEVCHHKSSKHVLVYILPSILKLLGNYVWRHIRDLREDIREVVQRKALNSCYHDLWNFFDVWLSKNDIAFEKQAVN